MNFVFFILLTATLFIRPGEIIPALRGIEFFFYLVLPCLLLSFQSMMGQLSQRNLKSQPISQCVIGLLLAVVLSNLSHFDIDGAITQGWTFFKNVIYYFLLVSLVNTTKRFRQLLFWLWFFILFYIILAVLQHKGFIMLDMEKAYEGTFTSTTSDLKVEVSRMRGSGLFADPNDICMVIVTGFMLSIYWMNDRLYKLPRIVCLISLLIFGYALMQTQSRGGFIALVAACLILLLAFYGWKKGAMLSALGLPVLLVVFGGRMTTISTQETTGKERLWQWSDALDFFKSSPLFGIGTGKFVEYSGLVAHNAYLQAYAETGFFGGTLFFGIFYLSVWTLYRMGGIRADIADPTLQWAQYVMIALLSGIATLMLTLSQTYYITTYMIFGLVTAYLRVSNASNILGDYRVDSTLIKRLMLTSIIVIMGIYVFVQLFR